jgi:hypothetical protein
MNLTSMFYEGFALNVSLRVATHESQMKACAPRGQPHFRLATPAKGARNWSGARRCGAFIRHAAQLIDRLEQERRPSGFKLLVALLAGEEICKKCNECRALIALLHHQSSPDHADEPRKGDRSLVRHVDLRDRDGYGLSGPTWKEPKPRLEI